MSAEKININMNMILQSIAAATPFVLSSILFLLLIIKYLPPKLGSKKFKLPPGPMKIPIIGNLHQLAISKLQPHQRLSELAKQHGPVMHLQLGELSFVVVSTSETAKEVLKTNDPMFANRPPSIIYDLTCFGKSSIFFAPNGEYWRQMRKIAIHELLTAKRVRSFRAVREEEVKNLVSDVSSTQGSVFNLTEKVIAFTNNVTCKAAFGQGLQSKQQEELIHLLREMLKMMGGFSFTDLYPSLKLHRTSGTKQKIGHFNENMNNLLDNILNNHKISRSDRNKATNRAIHIEDGADDSPISSHVENLVDVFLRLQESNESGFPITTNDIKGVIIDIFSAGTETSATTIDWAMAEMLRNPSVMRKARVEVREALRGKKYLEESDIEGLKYLKLVLKETLRLHPLAALIPRAPNESGGNIQGYDVPHNSAVLVNLWAIARDPRNWQDPEKFEPERFLESPVEYLGTHFQYTPFGAGRRICPGIAFATANMEMVLAALLCHFDWELPNGENPQELDMSETFGRTLTRRDDLNVIATKVH